MDNTGSMDDIFIREYNEKSDYEGVFLIENSGRDESYSASVFLRQAAVLHPSTFLVTEKNNIMAGYTIGAFVHEKPGIAWIIRLGIHPRFRNQGIGKKLFGTLMGSLIGNGATEILLSVSPDNLPARRIYQQHGFQIIGEKKDYFGEGEDRLIEQCLKKTGMDRV